MPRKNPITTRSSRSNTRKSPITNSKVHSKEDEKRKTRQSFYKSPQVELSPIFNHPQSTPSPSLFTRSKIQKGQSPKTVNYPVSNERLTRSKEKVQRKSSDFDTPKTKQSSPRNKRNLRDNDNADDKKSKAESVPEIRLTRSGKRTRSSSEQHSSVDDNDSPAKRRRTRSSQGTPLLSELLRTNEKKSTNSVSPRRKSSPAKSSKRTTRHSLGNKAKIVDTEEDDGDGEEEEEEEEEDDYNGNVNKNYKKGRSQSGSSSTSKKKPKKAVNDRKISKNVKKKKSPVKVKPKARRRSASASAKKDFTLDLSSLSSPTSRTRSRSRGRRERPANDIKVSPRASKGRQSTQRSESAHKSSGQRRSIPNRKTRRTQKSQKSKKMPPDQPSRQNKDEEERMEEGSSAEQEASEDGTKSIDMEAEGETKTAPEKEQHVDRDETMNEPKTETEDDKAENSNKRKRSEDNISSEIGDPDIKKPKIEPVKEEETTTATTDDKQEVESEPLKDESTECPVESVVNSVIENVEKKDSRASVITSSTSSSDAAKEDVSIVKEDTTVDEKTPASPLASKLQESEKEDAKEASPAKEESLAESKKSEKVTQDEDHAKESDEQKEVSESSSKQTPEKESLEAEKEKSSEQEMKTDSPDIISSKIDNKEATDGVDETKTISKKDDVEGNSTIILESESKEVATVESDNFSNLEATTNDQDKTTSDTTSKCSIEGDSETDKIQLSGSTQDQGSSEMDAELRLSETNSSASHSEMETSLEKCDESLPETSKEETLSSEPVNTVHSEELQPDTDVKPSNSSSVITSDSKTCSEEAMDVDDETPEKPPSAEGDSKEMEIDVDNANTLSCDSSKVPSESPSETSVVNKEEKSEVASVCTKETKIESESIPKSENNDRLSSGDKDSSASSETQRDAPTVSTIPPDKELDLTDTKKNTEEANSNVSNSIATNSDEHKVSDDDVNKQAPDAHVTSGDAVIDNSSEKKSTENTVESKSSSSEGDNQKKDAVSSVTSKNDNIEQNGAPSESCDKEASGDVSQNPPVSEVSEEQKLSDHINSPKSNGVMVESELDIISATAGETLNRKFVYNSLLDSQTIEAANEKKFAVVSYNLQGLDGINTNHENLLNELKQLEPCILCVQDVDAPYFENTLQPSLKGLGYSGIYRKNKIAEKGLATMYLTSVFEALDHKALDVHDLVQKDIENSGLEANEKEALSSYLDHSLFVLYTKLKSLSSQKCICICNASFPAEDLSLHALQIAVTVRELTNQSEGSGNPHILCGTFNMEESCPGYQILKDGYLSNEMIEDLQGRKNVPIPNKENAALVNLLWKCFQHPSSNLKSSYNTVVGDNAKTSRNFHSSKDSVWFSSDSLQLLGVLDISDTTSETNKNVHLSLKARFSFIN